MKKKILLLGGSYGQLPAIVEAKKRGLHTILCDYLPQNPGREIADEFYLVSTTDKEKVLKLAEEKKIDSVLAYASDPAALTAAYISEKLGLVGNTPGSVELLSQKDLFREFQRREGFNTPKFRVVESLGQLNKSDVDEMLPVVVKPVDSSDTKGVTLVENMADLGSAVQRALDYSTRKKCIIEERIGRSGGRLHGDGFVIDGKMKFCELGDQAFTSKAAPLKPSGTIYPSKIRREIVQSVEESVDEIIQKSGYQNGPVNIEARIDESHQIYIMEIGPRSGGILTPQGIFLSTGFDMLGAQFDLVLGDPVNVHRSRSGFCLRFTLHSNKSGIYRGFKVPEQFEPFVEEVQLYVTNGDRIKSFDQPGSNLGVILFTFKSREVMDDMIENFYEEIESAINIDIDQEV